MPKKLIIIGGPTASGKTSLAIQLAKYFNTEILSADSRQCYTELNIGVAKPTQVQLQEVCHHFINSHTIRDELSAGDFERFALRTLAILFEQHDHLICVGGTGLYLQALAEGLDSIPKVDMEIKQEIEDLYTKNGLLWLQGELHKADRNSFDSIDIHNPMRLMRALIFFRTHGTSIVNFRKGVQNERPFEIDYYAIKIEREELYQRINTRVDQMIQEGLLGEVERLTSFKHLSSLQTVGYKELFDYLDGKTSLEFAIEKIKQHTRNYAKRQITWFKNKGNYNFLSADDILAHLVQS